MKADQYPRFSKATFGDMFKTMDGTRAIYIQRLGDFDITGETGGIHVFYIEGVGCKRYYDDGRSVDGTASDDIIGRDYFIAGWAQAEINDCLKKCRRYIAAVEKRNSKDGKRIGGLLELIDKTRKHVMI